MHHTFTFTVSDRGHSVLSVTLHTAENSERFSSISAQSMVEPNSPIIRNAELDVLAPAGQNRLVLSPAHTLQVNKSKSGTGMLLILINGAFMVWSAIVRFNLDTQRFSMTVLTNGLDMTTSSDSTILDIREI